MPVKEQLVESEIPFRKNSGPSMTSQQIANQNFVPFTPTKKKLVKSWDFFELDVPRSEDIVETPIVGFQLKLMGQLSGNQHYGIIGKTPPSKFEYPRPEEAMMVSSRFPAVPIPYLTVLLGSIGFVAYGLIASSLISIVGGVTLLATVLTAIREINGKREGQD